MDLADVTIKFNVIYIFYILYIFYTFRNMTPKCFAKILNRPKNFGLETKPKWGLNCGMGRGKTCGLSYKVYASNRAEGISKTHKGEPK